MLSHFLGLIHPLHEISWIIKKKFERSWETYSEITSLDLKVLRKLETNKRLRC